MITLVDQRPDVRRELSLLPILLALILRDANDWGDDPQAWGGEQQAFGTDTGEPEPWGSHARLCWGTDTESQLPTGTRNHTKKE